MLSAQLYDYNKGMLYENMKYRVTHVEFLQELKNDENADIQNEIYTARRICRLLRDLPPKLREEVGYTLIGLLTDSSLQSLAADKQFMCSLIAIGDKNIVHVLAQKMLK